MEVRLGPRDDGGQTVKSFDLTTSPAATVFRFVDAFGNAVHQFDIVHPHQQLILQTRMQVRTSPTRALPERLDASAWDTLERLHADGQLWDYFEPSPRVPVSLAVRELVETLGLGRESDPLTCFRRIVTAIHRGLEYAPASTTVDTPLESVLQTRLGVCQDFAHVTLAVARAFGIPCRYVSGYLAPTVESPGTQNLTSHAWVEAWLPGLEWTALDPTHDSLAGEHHVSVAVGCDYGDAAPTRGMFRGGLAGPLSVSVRIERGAGDASTGEMSFPAPVAVSTAPRAGASGDQ